MSKFIFNDETQKNSHDFFLLNSGGRFSRFNDNPVMLYNHNRDSVIGKWTGLAIEGSLLTATPEFDEGDEEAKKLEGKVERGYLKGASPGIRILRAEYRSNEATDDLDLFVTEWELVEGSVVGIPSNPGALSLHIYDETNTLLSEDKVTDHLEHIVELSLTNNDFKKPKKSAMEIKLSAEASVALGLKDVTNSDAVNSAIIELHQRKETLKAENKELKEESEKARQKQVESLVDLAIKEGRINASKREDFIKLGLADFDTTQNALNSLPTKASLSNTIQQGSKIENGRENWTYLEWAKKDPSGLKRMKGEQPEEFAALKQRIK